MIRRTLLGTFAVAFFACLAFAIAVGTARDAFLSDCEASGMRTADECRQLWEFSNA